MSLAEKLEDYITASEGKPAIWGLDDCSSWAAGWVEITTGIKPPLPSYASEEEARELIAASGGLHMLWRDSMAEAGFLEDSFIDPKFIDLGDIALIQMSWGLSGAVFGTGGMAFIRSKDGVGGLVPRPKYIRHLWHLG